MARQSKKRSPRVERNRDRTKIQDGVSQQDYAEYEAFVNARKSKENKGIARAVVSDTAKTEITKFTRVGGTRLDVGETIFRVGNSVVIFDSLMAWTIAMELQETDDTITYLIENRDRMDSVFYVPAQRDLLRHSIVRTVSSEPGDTFFGSFDHLYPDHFPGVHIVGGGTGSGKSEFIERDLKPDVLVRWGEPMERFDNNSNVIHAYDFCSAMSAAFVFSLAGYTVAVDSIRELIFSLTGAAAAGGIKVELYTVLTSLNNLAAQQGVIIALAMNPMVVGDKEDEVYNAVGASVAGTTLVENSSPRRISYRSFTKRIFIDGSYKQRSDRDIDQHLGPHAPKGTRTDHSYFALRPPVRVEAIDERVARSSQVDEDDLLPPRQGYSKYLLKGNS